MERMMSKLLLSVVLVLAHETSFASFSDCRQANWFRLFIDLKAEGSMSRYVQRDTDGNASQIVNSDSNPIYLVVEGKDTFKLSSGKTYEHRYAGWKKRTFTVLSDIGSGGSETVDATGLDLDLETLAKLGLSRTAFKALNSDISKCGAGRPSASLIVGRCFPIMIHIKTGSGSLSKFKGNACSRPNSTYNPASACCGK